MHKSLTLLTSIVILLIAACSSDDHIEKPQNEEGQIPVLLSTRAEGSNWDTGSQVGLFMVYGTMQSTNNYQNNLLLQNNGTASWTSQHPIYWIDDGTAADFIGYSPYNSDIPDAFAYSFQVNADQSSSDRQKASDFMWGKLATQTPNDQVLNMTLGHLFSRVIVHVVAGEGFTEQELRDGTLSVRLNAIRTQATINLATGVVTAVGDPTAITPLDEGELTYSAVVVPQQIAQKELITINFVGFDYPFTHTITFETCKQYTFTVTLKKISSGLNIGISDWDVVDEDFGGTVN